MTTSPWAAFVPMPYSPEAPEPEALVDWDNINPLQRMVLQERYDEQRARREERAKVAAREAAAERREELLFASGQYWSKVRDLSFDPFNPHANIPSPVQQAEMAEAAETVAMQRRAKQLLREAGLPLDMLKPLSPPPGEVLQAVEPTPAEKAAVDELELARKRRRSDHAGLLARIRRVTQRRPAEAVARSADPPCGCATGGVCGDVAPDGLPYGWGREITRTAADGGRIL